MFDKINYFINSASSWLTAISLVVSAATLINMLRLNHKVRRALDKNNFDQKKKSIIKKLDGYAGSIQDGIYNENFLNELDLFLLEIYTSYTFFHKKLSIRLHLASFFICKFCMKDVRNGKKKYHHKLSRQIRKILALIRKE